jgi:hypothetical protein
MWHPSVPVLVTRAVCGVADNSHDSLILDELRIQTRWLRLLGLQALRPVLLEVLRTDKQRAVFEYSDGARSVREIARLAGVGAGSVSRMWSQWIAAGICVESTTAPGRAQHLASLSHLGLEVPVLVVTTSGINETGAEELSAE